MGRKSTITVKISKQQLNLKKRKIEEIFTSKVKPFSSSSGAYIPMKGEYKDHNVLVLLLEK